VKYWVKLMSHNLKSGCRPRFGSSRFRNKERGATLVESAFVYSLILIPTLLGIMGFGHALYGYHFVNHAAKEAARWGAVNGYSCSNDGTCSYSTGAAAGDIQTYATNMIPAGIDSSKVNAAASWPTHVGGLTVCTIAATQNSTGCTVQVTVSYAFNFIFPLLPVSTTTTSPCTQPGWCISSTSQMYIIH
jgi:Flp pilus assembly protein TadG